MRHTFPTKFTAVFLALAAALLAGNRLLAADLGKPPASRAPHGNPVAIPPGVTLPSTTVPPPYYLPQLSTPVPTQPCPHAAPSTMEKLIDLGTHLGRALDLAVDLLSGNEADLLSKNNTALLSGNKPEILSGNNPKVLSENTTPILSGNSFSMFSNIKVEVHIDHSGNSTPAGATSQPVAPPMVPSPEPSRTQPRKK